MGILRHLQHWLMGRGPQLLTTEFVPETHAIRQWADTFPWDALVEAVEQSFARRFPKKRPQGGLPSVSPRVLLALELLKHELGASDEDICQRLRTDMAVMYACGLRETRPRARKGTLCSLRPSASFVAASTRRSWMS